DLDNLYRIFLAEKQWFLLPYYALVLSQRPGKAQTELLLTLERHPHPGVAMVGAFMAEVRAHEGRGRYFINQYLFAKGHWVRLVDWIGLFWFLAESHHRGILVDLKKQIENVDQPCSGLVPVFEALRARIEQTLATL
ncbi:MAG: hypothetical protein ACRD5Z_19780, partial [Bryobacteraceae bacterium]